MVLGPLCVLSVQCLARPGLCLISAVASQPRHQPEDTASALSHLQIIGLSRGGVEITIGTLSGIGE